MKKFLLLTLLYLPWASAEQGEQAKELELKARQITGDFAAELKSALLGAVQQGGFAAAIDVCHTKAPEIADAYSSHGWQVRRTSLKTRNKANEPTFEELAVLQGFAQKLAEGEAIKSLTYSNYDPEKNQYRYMKPIPTGQLCLACHGEKISPQLIEKLDSLYVGDEARGFKLGDMRGAFSLSYSGDGK
ncbi:DUF3365 domain-containing protein [Pseudoalteromonas sp. YIC-827]|uniref:DUF3365 domain-containing protein n=1 Tax=Pseudoalteromonas qingdaonensis TaxID=3131913 RepID=A0ABU9MY10_9GAMM